jgi:hypothetical protein
MSDEAMFEQLMAEEGRRLEGGGGRGRNRDRRDAKKFRKQADPTSDHGGHQDVSSYSRFDSEEYSHDGRDGSVPPGAGAGGNALHQHGDEGGRDGGGGGVHGGPTTESELAALFGRSQGSEEHADWDGGPVQDGSSYPPYHPYHQQNDGGPTKIDPVRTVPDEAKKLVRFRLGKLPTKADERAAAAAPDDGTPGGVSADCC